MQKCKQEVTKVIFLTKKWLKVYMVYQVPLICFHNCKLQCSNIMSNCDDSDQIQHGRAYNRDLNCLKRSFFAGWSSSEYMLIIFDTVTLICPNHIS